MFGLKIIKKQEYLDILERNELYQREAADKAVQVSNLEGEVKFLNGRVSELEQQVKDLYVEKTKTNQAVLLEDVAEAPLEVAKPVKKTRKVVKKTEGTKTRKKVVHKSEETE